MKLLLQPVTLPVRLALRTTRVLVHVGEDVLERLRGAHHDHHGGPGTAAPAPTRPRTAPVPPPQRPGADGAAEPAADAPTPVVDTTAVPDAVDLDAPPAQPEFEAPHIEEDEPQVVYSSADEGAGDGAGATLRIDEPWDGYRGMTAADVVDRLVVSDRATLAAVQLYEQAHRARRTVLDAVQRQLSAA